MSEPVKAFDYELVAELPVIGHFAMGSAKKNIALLEKAGETGKLPAKNPRE